MKELETGLKIVWSKKLNVWELWFGTELIDRMTEDEAKMWAV